MQKQVHSYTGSPALDHSLAGIGGATVSTITLHPLDLIKIRLQVDATSHKHALIGRAIRTTRDIIKIDGILGLYRGIIPNLAGNCASWGLYFAWYTWIKEMMAGGSQIESVSGASTLSPIQHLVSGAAAGALTQCMANPLWVVKTRMCTTSRNDPAGYRGLIDGLVQITRKEGLRGLYRGLAPGLLGVPHGGLQFMAYEELKRRRLRSFSNDQQYKFTSTEYALMSSSSKMFALAITYPSQVLRSRLQQQPNANHPNIHVKPSNNAHGYKGLCDAIISIFSKEGASGFYKGFGPSLLRMLPGNIITFLVYENIASFFRRNASK